MALRTPRECPWITPTSSSTKVSSIAEGTDLAPVAIALFGDLLSGNRFRNSLPEVGQLRSDHNPVPVILRFMSSPGESGPRFRPLRMLPSSRERLRLTKWSGRRSGCLASWPKWQSGRRKLLLPKGLARCHTSANRKHSSNAVRLAKSQGSARGAQR